MQKRKMDSFVTMGKWYLHKGRTIDYKNLASLCKEGTCFFICGKKGHELSITLSRCS